jgi:hypothetical protein
MTTGGGGGVSGGSSGGGDGCCGSAPGGDAAPPPAAAPPAAAPLPRATVSGFDDASTCARAQPVPRERSKRLSTRACRKSNAWQATVALPAQRAVGTAREYARTSSPSQYGSSTFSPGAGGGPSRSACTALPVHEKRKAPLTASGEAAVGMTPSRRRCTPQQRCGTHIRARQARRSRGTRGAGAARVSARTGALPASTSCRVYSSTP